MLKEKLISDVQNLEGVDIKIKENLYLLLKYAYIEDDSNVCVYKSDKNNSVVLEYRLEDLKQGIKRFLIVETYISRYVVYMHTTSSYISFKLNELYKIVNYTKVFYRPLTNKLCLFTGAFNPCTIAHYHMIESALNIYDFDYVVFAVSYQAFLDRKQQRNGDWAFDEIERLNMLLAMTYQNPKVLIYGVERGYTYDVLCDVQKKYTPTELYFAMGSDKLKEIGRWGHHDQLLSQFCFYVLQRSDTMGYIKTMCNKLFKNTKYIIGKDNEEYKSVSATDIRRRIETNVDYSDLVVPEVYEILKNRV